MRTRRGFVLGVGAGLAATVGLASAASSLVRSRAPSARRVRGEFGALRAPDANGVRLPAGFTSRVIARAGRRIAGGYRWHLFPDGGATFATDDGGWIYASNCEASAFLGGGASAIRFGPGGTIVDAYRILSGTNRNCAGGATPWGTWLSCEETPFGRVHECDPHGVADAVTRDALGHFKHEAVAVDARRGHLYMTEDEPDGRLYRFVPATIDADGVPDLAAGRLQVARVERPADTLRWIDVPDPRPDRRGTPTRMQVPTSSAFNGGEGICHHDGTLHFTTKGDNRVWRVTLDTQRLTVVYDARRAVDPVLRGVDNLAVSSNGDVLVAEDGDDMQIVAIGGDAPAPLLQVTGQDDSELTGPAFSPDGTRLYFSSQRGARGALHTFRGIGLTYEVSGPFAAWFADRKR